VIHGIGIDIVQLARIRDALARHGRRFLERIFCPGEIEQCDAQGDRLASGEGRIVCYAVRFAAKEAAFKAFGATGLGDASAGSPDGGPGATRPTFDALSWHDFEVETDASGAPSLRLSERAAAVSDRLGITRVALSLSTITASASAIVVAEK